MTCNRAFSPCLGWSLGKRGKSTPEEHCLNPFPFWRDRQEAIFARNLVKRNLANWDYEGFKMTQKGSKNSWMIGFPCTQDGRWTFYFPACAHTVSISIDLESSQWINEQDFGNLMLGQCHRTFWTNFIFLNNEITPILQWDYPLLRYIRMLWLTKF